MAKKQLSDWAAIAEIIGAVAIVFSLLYVGFEIQRNTKVGLASNRQEIAARAQELALYSAETGIYRLLFDESADTAELTAVEQDRLTAYIGALLRTTEEAYLLHRDGLLDDEYWMTRAGVMMAALRTDEARQIYVQTRALGFYTSDFADWADQALKSKYGD
jgi:hypothetical protein